MANLIRTAKSGSDWTKNDLKAYNIRVDDKNEKEFFDIEEFHTSHSIPEDFLMKEIVEKPIDKKSYDLITHLDLATRTVGCEESAVDDFVVQLFRSLQYDRDDRIIRTRKNIRLFTCGENVYAKTDVCIMNDDEIILLVQENKSYQNIADPEPQVIAEAIAAFQENNTRRERILGIAPRQECTIPCITMTGTSPIFYKVCITRDLDDHISLGTYPELETIVHRYVPRLEGRRKSEGMKPLENRRKILQYFEAFKKFIG